MKKILFPTLIAMLFTSNVQAGLFDDEEARKYIKTLEAKYELRFKELEQKSDNQSTQQMNLFQELQNKNDEIAKLRGEVEVLQYQLEQTKKSQKDFYLDLESRLSPIEKEKAEKQKKLAEETQAQNQEYEQNLEKFKDQKFKEASWGFAAFLKKYPNSELTGSSIFWLANSFYATKEYKKAIDQYNKFIETYPQDRRIPDAMLTLAFSHYEMKSIKTYEQTLENIVKLHPQSDAAKEAKKRLSETTASKSKSNKK